MAPEPYVSTPEQRAIELMRTDPALFGWLVALGAGSGHWPAPVTDGATEDTAGAGRAPAPPALAEGLALAHGGHTWSVARVQDEKQPYRVANTVSLWTSILLSREAVDDMDPYV